MHVVLGIVVLLLSVGSAASLAEGYPLQIHNLPATISDSVKQQKRHFLYNQSQVLQGWFTADGSLYTANGILRGWITTEGEIYNQNGILKGWLNPDGSIYNHNGVLQGWLTTEGEAYNQNGIFQGWWTPEGDVYNQQRILIGYGKVDDQTQLGVYFFFLEKLGLTINQ